VEIPFGWSKVGTIFPRTVPYLATAAIIGSRRWEMVEDVEVA